MKREKGLWEHFEGREEKTWQEGQRDEQKAFWCMLLIGMIVVQIVMKKKKFNQVSFFFLYLLLSLPFLSFQKTEWKQVFDILKYIRLKPQLWGSYELQRAIKELFPDKNS